MRTIKEEEVDLSGYENFAADRILFRRNLPEETDSFGVGILDAGGV
jgi:hypothetical protein